MAAAVMVVTVFLIAVPNIVVVAPARVEMVAGLPIFSVRFALNTATLQMSVTFGLMSFQPHKSFTFFDPATLQPIPYSSGSVRTSNTWTNPNSKPTVPTSNQPSAMLTNSSSHRNGHASSTWIPDSSASLHVTGESQNIKQFTHLDGLDQIFIGNGEGLSISGVGSSSCVP